VAADEVVPSAYFMSRDEEPFGDAPALRRQLGGDAARVAPTPAEDWFQNMVKHRCHEALWKDAKVSEERPHLAQGSHQVAQDQPNPRGGVQAGSDSAATEKLSRLNSFNAAAHAGLRQTFAVEPLADSTFPGAACADCREPNCDRTSYSGSTEATLEMQMNSPHFGEAGWAAAPPAQYEESRRRCAHGPGESTAPGADGSPRVGDERRSSEPRQGAPPRTDVAQPEITAERRQGRDFSPRTGTRLAGGTRVDDERRSSESEQGAPLHTNVFRPEITTEQRQEGDGTRPVAGAGFAAGDCGVHREGAAYAPGAARSRSSSDPLPGDDPCHSQHLEASPPIAADMCAAIPHYGDMKLDKLLLVPTTSQMEFQFAGELRTLYHISTTDTGPPSPVPEDRSHVARPVGESSFPKVPSRQSPRNLLLW